LGKFPVGSWSLRAQDALLIVLPKLYSAEGIADSVNDLPHASHKKNLPLEIRVEIYERSKSLRQRGLNYSQIRTMILESYGFAPSKSSLSEWLNGCHNPLGSANRFVASPTPELAYVIGVKFGDGSINLKGYNRRIRLQSIDRDFVQEFDRCVSTVLRTERHALWADKKRREIHVEARSVLLYNFLRQSLGDLKAWIEHCDRCVSAFLRGFFDSEGSVTHTGELWAYNNDTDRLGYVMKLLRNRFGVETTGPHLGKRQGSKIERRGRSYLRNSDTYGIYIRRESMGGSLRGLASPSIASSVALRRYWRAEPPNPFKVAR
jgi:DNA endonuclease